MNNEIFENEIANILEEVFENISVEIPLKIISKIASKICSGVEMMNEGSASELTNYRYECTECKRLRSVVESSAHTIRMYNIKREQDASIRNAVDKVVEVYNNGEDCDDCQFGKIDKSGFARCCIGLSSMQNGESRHRPSHKCPGTNKYKLSLSQW